MRDKTIKEGNIYTSYNTDDKGVIKIKKKISQNLNNMHSEDKADEFFNLIIKLSDLCSFDCENFERVFLYDDDVDKVLFAKKKKLEEFKKEYKLDKPLLYIIFNIVAFDYDIKEKFEIVGEMSLIEKKLRERYAKHMKEILK